MPNSSGSVKCTIMEITSKEREVRPNSIADVKVDASFRKIARNAICFHVWKIEEDRLEAEPKSNYGTFYDDCAYIIYAASPIGCFVNQHTITREVRIGTHLERFIHFWLGDKVSEQKRSNVTHKIQELDSYFGNVATEFRETQDNESARFLSYFKKGMTVLCGELAAANKLDRLYQLRGRKWLRCIEMPNIAWEHFGSDYIMLLQTAGDGHVYMWIGRSSSNIERRDAIELVNRFQSDTDKITIVDDGYEQSMPEARKEVWNHFLPLSKRVVSQNSWVCDKLPPSTNKMKIYKCSYQGTRLHLDQLDVVIPTRDDLSDSTAVYVLDGHYDQGVWLWAGAQASNTDKISAMGNGRAFVKKKKYPYATPIVRVLEGCEPIEFIRLFPNWPSDWNDCTSPVVKPISTLHGKFDTMTLCQRPKMAAETQLIDDGTGDRKIFHICSDQIIELANSPTVTFTTNNCYVVEYYVVTTPNAVDNETVGVQSIIYQWNGSEAKAELMQRTERFARKSFEESGMKSMFVQMSEGDEYPHFLQIFGGKLIILLNDKYLQINNNNLDKASTTSFSNQDTFVLRIYGDATYNSKAVEVYPLNAMNSKECYVMKTVTDVWVWCGNGSTGDAREMAKSIGRQLGESNLVLEGKEPKEFWRSISSQLNKHHIVVSHHNSPPLSNGNTNGNGYQRASSSSPPFLNGSGSFNGSSNGGVYNQAPAKTRPLAQLFIVSLHKDMFQSREIIGYDQEDLSPECVYILDAGQVTYVWLGTQAATHERDNFMRLAQNYMETVPIARRPSTAVAIVKQNWEPNVFKGFFDKWSTHYWKDYKTYEMKRQLFVSATENTPYTNGKSVVNGENGCSPLPTALLRHQKDFDRHNKYPIATLQQEADTLPVEVDPSKRELHLTHDDFMALFKMPFKEFQELPMWRQHELKKKHKLF